LAGFDVIADLLRRTRRRLALVHAACGLSEVLAVAAGVLLAVVLLGPWAPAELLRAVLLAAVAAGLVFAAVRRGLSVRRQAAGDDRAARYVEQRFPTLGSGLITAVQVRRAQTDPRRARGMSGGLAEAAVLDAAERVAGLPGNGIVPLSALRDRGLVLVGLGLCWGLCLGLLPGRVSEGLQWLVTPGEETADTAETVGEPVAGDLVLDYRFPAHTGLDDRRVVGSDGRVEALKGTRVTLSARTFEPVTRAAFVLEPTGGEPRRVPLEVAGQRELLGTFDVLKPGTWRLAVTTAGGDALEEERGHPIRVLEDERPGVELLSPAADGEMDVTDPLELAWSARDDFGLSEVALVWQIVHAGGDPGRRPLGEEPAGRVAVSGKETLPLAELDVEPGDEIALFVQALDNDGVDGPKAGDSATRILRIRSPQLRHDALMTRLREAWEAMLDVLADRLEADPKPQTPEGFAAARTLVESHGEKTLLLLSRLGDILQGLEEDPLAREDLYKGVRLARNELEKHLRAEEEALVRATRRADVGRLRPVHLASLRRTGERAVEGLEHAILRLEELFRHQSLADLEELSKRLLASQARLRELLEQYKRSPDLETKRQILREIARLRARIAQLLQRMAELMRKLPMEHLNRGAFKHGLAAKSKALVDRLQRLQEMLLKGDIDQALEELERLENELQALQSQLSEDRASTVRQEDMWRSELSALQEATRQVRQEQERLAKATEAVERAADERLREALERRLKGRLDTLREKVAALRSTLRRLVPPLADTPQAEALKGLEANARRLAASLKEKDLGMARDVAETTHERARRLRRDVAREAAFPSHRGRAAGFRRAEGDAGRAEAMAEEIRDDLASLLPDPEERFDSAERRALRRLDARQQRLRQEADQLSERAASIQEFLPLEGGELQGKLGKAAGHMEDAGDHLGGRRTRPARVAQGRAIEALKEAEGDMKSCQRPGNMGGRGRPATEDVEIVHDRKTPAEYREHIVEGMRRQAPEEYQEQVDRYYRELVR